MAKNEKNFETLCSYVKQTHSHDLIRILLQREDNAHYSVIINGTDLLEKHTIFAEILFFQSEELFKLFDEVLIHLSSEICLNHHLRSHMTLKPNIHARFEKLPRCAELWRDRVPKSRDVGSFLAVQGTVIRTCSSKILESRKEFVCGKCGNAFTLEASFEQNYSIVTPTRCPVGKECNSKKFVSVEEPTRTSSGKSGGRCIDYQEVKVQEQIRRLAMGTIPRSVTVVLENDLVDVCKAGDDVVIFGAVSCRWSGLNLSKPCQLELVMKANNVVVSNDERRTEDARIDLDDEFQCFWAAHEGRPMAARNLILESMCPQVYGLYVVKLAVALILAGGVARTDATGSRVRGECHLLLVGDPGTGKSQFLKYASKIMRRSVLTTGVGSSTAGLTVSATRDGPHWVLEAGALVLADGGVCCVDEFSGIKEHDRSAIHEAMEQQTISVAKAGLVCKLNTRTSILAATNPKLGKYDEYSNVETNIAMASPLLSRFDLVLVLLDTQNPQWDSVVADYLLKNDAVKSNTQLWNLQRMQAYFATIRQFTPQLTHEADTVLKRYYQAHRRSDSRNAARTTLRLLESLIRLAEAHAKLMFRSHVTVQDAVAAVTVVESSMQGASLLATGSILHSCFPHDGDEEYLKHSRLVLGKLGLDGLLGCDATHTTTQQTQQTSAHTTTQQTQQTSAHTTTQQTQQTSTHTTIQQTQQTQQTSTHTNTQQTQQQKTSTQSSEMLNEILPRMDCSAIPGPSCPTSPLTPLTPLTPIQSVETIPKRGNLSPVNKENHFSKKLKISSENKVNPMTPVPQNVISMDANQTSKLFNLDHFDDDSIFTLGDENFDFCSAISGPKSPSQAISGPRSQFGAISDPKSTSSADINAKISDKVGSTTQSPKPPGQLCLPFTLDEALFQDSQQDLFKF